MPPLTFLGLLGLLALLLFVVGQAKDAELAAYHRTGVRARGVVVRNEYYWGRNGVLRPVVRFRTQHGELVEAPDLHGLAFAVPRFGPGESVWLVYQPASPRDFRILSPGQFG